MRVSFTVDMEHDCPPQASTYRGVEEGTPRLLSLLASEGVPATFFTTGDVARRYPDLVRRIIGEGHELGCHGDTHAFFSDLDHEQARREIRDSTETLRRFYPVTSFRAPALDFPTPYLRYLKEEGYRVDSSQSQERTPFVKPEIHPDFSRLPATMPAWVMRLPLARFNQLLTRVLVRGFCSLQEPIILYVHPWELVDMSNSPLRLRSRIFTGEPMVRGIRHVLRYLKSRNARFHRIEEIVA